MKGKTIKEKAPGRGAEKELEKCRKERDEYLAGWQRARADFLNYKKKEDERKKEFLEFAAEEFILGLLPVLDNFHLAEKEAAGKKAVAAEIAGFLQIKKQLESFLRGMGLEEIKAAGEKFDPRFHEVVGEAEARGKKPGTVAEEERKGYAFRGRVIRPARVKVAKEKKKR